MFATPRASCGLCVSSALLLAPVPLSGRVRAPVPAGARRCSQPWVFQVWAALLSGALSYCLFVCLGKTSGLKGLACPVLLCPVAG